VWAGVGAGEKRRKKGGERREERERTLSKGWALQCPVELPPVRQFNCHTNKTPVRQFNYRNKMFNYRNNKTPPINNQHS
jgi:hypothetical protein